MIVAKKFTEGLNMNVWILFDECTPHNKHCSAHKKCMYPLYNKKIQIE